MALGARIRTRELAIGAAVLALGAALVAGLFWREREAIVADAYAEARRTLDSMGVEAADLFRDAAVAVATVESADLPALNRDEALRAFLAFSQGPVQRGGRISSLYIGFPDGAFWQQRGVRPSFLEARTLDGIVEARGYRRVLADGQATWFYDAGPARGWVAVPEPRSDYDPRTRPWYELALDSPGPVWTEPYRAASSDDYALTLAHRVRGPDGALWGIAAVDILVTPLNATLARWRAERLPAGASLVVADEQGRAVARAAGAAADAGVEAALSALARDGREARARATIGGKTQLLLAAPLGAALDLPLVVVASFPLDAVTGPAIAALILRSAVLALVLLVLAAIAIYATRLRGEVRARLAAQAEAEAATKAKSEFLAMMSHEIRTPMNGVMAMAEMLDQTALDADQRAMSGTIRGSAAALLAIINDILDFSKIEAGKLDLERARFSLRDTIEGVAELLAPRLRGKDVALHLDLDPAIPDAREGDEARLRQVLLNLAGNAVKFTETGYVTLAAKPLPGAKMRLEVRDTGIGLTDEQRARLFRPFEQADASTTRKYGGTGLGLSICRRLVDLMGGTIGCDSEPGKGSTFWFEIDLPVLDAAPDRPRVDVSDAKIVAIDFPDSVRFYLERALRAAGVTEIEFVAGENLGVAAMAARPAPWVFMIRADATGDRALALGPRLPRAILLAARDLGSTLSAADTAGFAAKVALPPRRHALWDALGAALGRLKLDDRVEGAAAAIGWTPPPIDEAARAGCLILVAEDNPTNQLVIGRLLGARGYAHEIVDDGKLALAALDARRYGLLLTDFHMPEMDGFALTAAIRKREESSGAHIPIVALTADALPGTERRCLEAGMDGYLTKPIEAVRLEATLDRFLPQAKALRTRGKAPAPAPKPAARVDPFAKIDPDVFDPGRMVDVFGAFGAEAREFLGRFLADVPQAAARVPDALASGDPKAAHHAAHALKGSAASVGAARLSRLAGDVQDALEAEDTATAELLAGLLDPTVVELRDALAPLLQGSSS
jgi:signal transduction histidine kinase/HPt (histidine-containing phosphotransfer) domain-containing protein/ActR/RegA family two-component response regulator